jgi:ParB family chromosome partitioning protein
MKRKVLGRGLEALITQDLRESVAETERVKELEIDRIDPNPGQPRGGFDAGQLEQLASSIKTHGVLQPIIVRREGERYQLVVGERRLRASKMAGKSTIPAIVRDVTDENSLKYALLENLQREDLNPIEEARGYNALKENYGLTDKNIAEILGKDRSTISNTLRLLKLPHMVIGLLETGKLRAGHARALLSIEGEKAQIEWARRVVEEGISVREVEETTRRGKRGKRRARRVDPQIRAIEDKLEMHLGTRVRLVSRRKGGILQVEYYSNEELERILELIGIEARF